MSIINKIIDETSKSNDEVYQHLYSNNILEYKSLLRGFNSKLFSTFGTLVITSILKFVYLFPMIAMWA